MPEVDISLRIGERNPDGTIKRDVYVCAITGQKIEAGDAMVPIDGTNKFYRCKAPLMWPQSQEQYGEAHAKIVALVTAPAAVTKAAPAPAAPSKGDQ